MALSVIADCVYISEISPRVNCVEHLSQIMLQSSFSIAVSRKKQSLLNVSFFFPFVEITGFLGIPQ